ncbi:MAG: DUF1059 domain-containing protein [Nitrospinae bacterium]|nr:DUF1059 domain-containing protein [Nitrospinota bacterium]
MKRRAENGVGVNCRDVGADCDFEARADTEEELFKILTEHAKNGHGMEEIPPELVEKVRAVIRVE